MGRDVLFEVGDVFVGLGNDGSFEAVSLGFADEVDEVVHDDILVIWTLGTINIQESDRATY